MFDFLFQEPMYEALIGHRPGVYNTKDAVACALALNHDSGRLPFGAFNGFQPEFLDEATYIDEWGTTYRHNWAAWPIDAPIDYPIKSRDDLERYRTPDPTLPGRTSALDEVHEPTQARVGREEPLGDGIGLRHPEEEHGLEPDDQTEAGDEQGVGVEGDSPDLHPG